MVSQYQTIAPRKTALVLLVIALISTTLGSAEEESLRDALPNDDFVVREEMIPMRDGVKLYTVIVSPKENSGAFPVMLERTPYKASSAISGRTSPRMKNTIGRRFLGYDYITIVQDVRGGFKSEGDYAMYRVPRDEFNKTETDETTDAWDTIDWIIKNIPSNGRVVVWGNSYPGWLTLAAMRDPHPALAAAAPLNPVVDVWKADDWFHWGAFRAFYAFDFIYGMETENDGHNSYPYENPDMYIWLPKQGNAEHGLGAHLDERHKMWHRIIENPSYGPYWRDVAADQWFDQPPRLVPALHVHSLWDEEDIYGSPAAYAALEKHDADNDMNFFVAGPWTHGGHFGDGNKLGDITFDEDTGKRYRKDVLKPFLRRYLHDDKDIEIAPVTVFETGSNRWRKFDQWPPPGDQARLYLQNDGVLAFSAPTDNSEGTEFISDLEHPVPYGPRPNFHWEDDASSTKWEQWLIEDQRFVDGRPDVVTWVSDALDHPVTIRGAVTAHLFAETTGTDADWVVKLIDVYPYDNKDFSKSGFQMMISADFFRGRYREDITKEKPIEANTVLEYTLPLPHVNHTILPGHRLMVQVQSTWYPLYDLNPQTFVPSIMSAPDDAYKKQQHRVHHSAEHAMYIEFRVDTRQ